MLDEILVNANTAGQPAIFGNRIRREFVVVWTDANGRDIRGAKFSNSGIKVGDDFSVATADDRTGWPVIAPIYDLFSPGFVVAWIVRGNVFFQQFNSNCVKSGGVIRANTTVVADGETWPAIAALPEGNFVISWGSGLQGIRAQIFHKDGTKLDAEIGVNSSDGEHRSPAITALGGGGFVIAWHRPLFGITPESDRLQIFDSDGTKLGGEKIPTHGVGLGPSTLSFIVPTGLDAPEPGDFVNVRLSSAGTGSEHTDPGAVQIVVAELFGPDGAWKSALNVTHVDDQTLSYSPAVTALPMLAGLVVTWTEKMSPTTGMFGHSIKAKRIEVQAEGAEDYITAGEAEKKVNTQPDSGQDYSCVAAFGENGEYIAVAWVDQSLTPPFRPAVKARVFQTAEV